MKALALLGFLVLSFSAALAGGSFLPGEWYAALEKPSWNPPSWVFGPVWTALYAMIGVSAWLVWKASGFVGSKAAFAIFFVQLVLNALWSWLFFGLHRPDVAFVEIVVLFLAILATIVLFWRVSKPAAILLMPYLAWVGFATLLNGALWRLNA